MYLRIVFTLFVLATIAALPLSAAELIQNGSFEEIQITGNYYQCIGTCTGGFIEPASYLPHWTVGLTSVDIVNSSVTGGGGGQHWSELGNQGIDMSGTPGPGSLSQTVTTGAGTQLTLSFWVSSNGGAIPQSLEVDWNGVAIAPAISSPAQDTWTQYTYSLIGGAGSTDTLTFVGLIGGNAGALLDNVSLTSLTATPEPGAVVLFGTLTGALALFVRRRRKA